MNRSDLENNYLLSMGRVHLPRTIDSPLLETMDAYISFWRMHFPEKPLKLFCRCDGGDAEESIAIANRIKQDGNIEGHLVGMSMSSGATIWAACAKRFIYPHAKLGIHPSAWYLTDVRLTAALMYSKFRDFRTIDRAACKIYSESSNQSLNWWWKFYNQPGDVKWLTSDKLIELQMGEMVNSQI